MNFKIFHLGQELTVKCSETFDNIIKIASQNDHVFLLTATKQLFFGHLNGIETRRNQLQLEIIRNDCIDVACSIDSIYVIDENGFVQHCPLMAFDFDKRWNDIPILNYNGIYEGVMSGGNHNNKNNDDDDGSNLHNHHHPIDDSCTRVVEVHCNNDGALFITENRELYAMGNFNDVCTSDQPIKVPQFVDFEILKVAMGKHFVILLTRKRTNSRKMHTKTKINQNCHENWQLTTNTGSKSCEIARSMDSNTTTNTCDDSESLRANASNVIPIKCITNDNSNETQTTNDYDMNYEIEKLTKHGNEQINTQVWCFGSINKGQLGIGDHVKRKQAVEIGSLRDQSVCQIYSGDEHTAALTLDGRLYLWGDNSNEQISHWLDREDYSSPRRWHKNEQNIFAVQCGQSSTFILMNNLDRHELSRNKHFSCINIRKLSDIDANGRQQLQPNKMDDFIFFANGPYLVCATAFEMLRCEKYLKIEQQFLQDILQKTKPSAEHFVQQISHNNLFKYPKMYQQFFHTYIHISELTATNISSMLDYSRSLISANAIAFICKYREFLHIYRLYTKIYCDIICSDDFARLHPIIIPQMDFTSKFIQPMLHTINYVEFLSELLTTNHKMGLLSDAIDRWTYFRNEMDLMLCAANATITFWMTNQKFIPNCLQQPERRIIIDSKEYAVKLLPSSRFKTNWFILFNDIFCHSTGNSMSSIKQYSLKTLWITNIIDKDVSPSSTSISSSHSHSSTSHSSSTSNTSNGRKYAIKITAPEEQFTLSAASNEIKMRWLNALEQQIKENVAKLNVTKLNALIRRTTTYTFSEKHRIYPSCKYFGQWYMGKMHGLGCIEYPDGRIYTGQFDMNVISGYGRLTIPNVSCYEGRFVDGKYGGFGALETFSNNENYEGFFRNGHKFGFGILTDNNRSYIGGFVAGLPHGYGVLDNSDTGEKYMGMFAEGQRYGLGFCISDDGKYFGGHFVDNELNGNGVAVFTDGSYYDGDLTIFGPCGRGTLYLPIEIIGDEFSCEMENRKVRMRGNILSGLLGGNWHNVRINNGNISINQEFTKYPEQLDQPMTDGFSKWVSLFSDWEHEVFGSSIVDVNDIRKLWQKITEHIQNAKQLNSLKSTISKSALIYESDAFMSRQQSHHITTINNNNNNNANNLFHTMQTTSSLSNQYDYQVLKSASLSHITAKKYKRNLLAIDRHKSISNEFLNTTTFAFMQNNNNLNQTPNDSNNSPDSIPIGANGTDNSNQNLFTFQNQMPYFGITKFDSNDYRLVRDYLTKAFKNQYHPLGVLNTKIAYCFYTSYGCWKVKPISIISTHAMREWESITKRIYDIVRFMFPKLPPEYCLLDDEFISYRSLLYPILLSDSVYSTLFVLYANKCSKRDEIYRQRIIFSEKKKDIELMEVLKIPIDHVSLIKHDQFELAIIELRKVKEKFCPREMLKLIEQTFKHVENAAQLLTEQNLSKQMEQFQSNDCNAIQSAAHIFQLNADNMMPLTIYLLLRAAIPHLGTEILLLEELMGPDFELVMHGFAGYCFTTIKAAYQHIINELFL